MGEVEKNVGISPVDPRGENSSDFGKFCEMLKKGVNCYYKNFSAKSLAKKSLSRKWNSNLVDSRQKRIDSYLPHKKGKVEKIHVRADGSKEKVESAVSITALQQSHLPARQKRQG